jgi:hypothetical protein
MFSQRQTSAIFVTAIVLGASLVGERLQAQVRPFRVSGAGTVAYIPFPGDPPANHWAVGNANMLGNYYADGWVRVDEFTSATTANFSSAVPVVFTAANGDELHFDYAGEVTIADAGGGMFTSVWVAKFTPVIGASTGRFERVIGGSFIMTASTAPFFFTDTDIPYSWEGNGTLEFQRGN